MKTNTINKKEIEKFSKIAEEWWDPKGKFKPLHKFNPIRISYIINNITKTFKINNTLVIKNELNTTYMIFTIDGKKVISSKPVPFVKE